MRQDLVSETVGGQLYEYVPLGRFIVSAPAVCHGRPTFKYTRIEVAGVLQRLAACGSIDELIAGFQGKITRESVEEAAGLAAEALVQQTPAHAHRP
jgi:uncharacterized protein (DUF433 family)